MKIYLTEEQKQIQEWKKRENFLEMARIGNLPKHKDISVWVNEKEEIHDPHFHLRFPDNTEIRLRFKDLSSMDKKDIDSNLRKELKNWLLSKNKKDTDLTNIRVMVVSWNNQENNVYILKMKELKWIN